MPGKPASVRYVTPRACRPNGNRNDSERSRPCHTRWTVQSLPERGSHGSKLPIGETSTPKPGDSDVLAATLLATVLGSSASQDTGPPESPAILQSSAPPSEVAYPVWVAASHARGAYGELDASKFEPGMLDHLQGFIDAAPQQLAPTVQEPQIRLLQPQECALVATALTWASLGEINTLNDLATRAHTVVSGEIVAVTPGFVFGSPASLLAVAVERFESVAERSPPPTLIYIAYPQGFFALDGVAFCGLHEKTAVPLQVGSRIVFLSIHGTADAADLMYVGSTETMVVQAPDGSIVVGEALLRKAMDEGNLDDLLELVEDARQARS